MNEKTLFLQIFSSCRLLERHRFGTYKEICCAEKIEKHVELKKKS